MLSLMVCLLYCSKINIFDHSASKGTETNLQLQRSQKMKKNPIYTKIMSHVLQTLVIAAANTWQHLDPFYFWWINYGHTNTSLPLQSLERLTSTNVRYHSCLPIWSSFLFSRQQQYDFQYFCWHFLGGPFKISHGLKIGYIHVNYYSYTNE